MSSKLGFLIVVAFLLLASSLVYAKHTTLLRAGFYHHSCPKAEAIVRNVVNKAILKNPGIAAGLIRLHFHDCFVRGCDASVLLKSTPGNPAEKDHPANNPSLRGFEVIDKAKALLEAACPKTVSCADILAFAARDSAKKTGEIKYNVQAGRRDGRISRLADVTNNLPPPSFNAKQLIANFARKGLSAEEMVILSGVHSIGRSHCSSFTSRLYPTQDPTLDGNYAAVLKKKCPPPSNSTIDPTVPLESRTPNVLDNMYYKELTRSRGLLASDQTLLTTQSTSKTVLEYAKSGKDWAKDFGKAMVHMGSIGVLTGAQGEIRNLCSKLN